MAPKGSNIKNSPGGRGGRTGVATGRKQDGAALLVAQKKLERRLQRHTAQLSQANEHLRESEQRYRLLFDRNPDGVFTVDSSGRFLLANPACESICGYPLSELLQKTFIELCAPDQLPRTLDHFQRGLREPGYTSLETALIHKDGRRVEVWIAGEAIVLGGKSATLHCTVKDITAHRQAEEALRESEEKMRAAFANAAVGFALTSPDGRFLEVNPAYCRLTGYDPEELRMTTLAQLIHPDDHAADRALLEQMLRGQAAGFVVENRYLRKDGNAIWVRKSVSVVRKADGEPRWIVGLVEDITKRKHAEQALRESKRLYRAIGESIDYGVWVCDAAGRNTYASESFLKMVGITQKECSEFGWGDLLHPEDAAATIAAWKKCAATGGTWYREHRFRGADGKWHPVLACGVPVRDEGGQLVGWAGINLNISRLKKAQEALRDSEQRFRVLADGTPVMIWVYDAKGGLRFANRAHCEFFGVTLGEMAGGKWRPFVHPEDVPDYVDVFLTCHAEHRAFHAQARVRRHDGQWRWIESFAAPRFSNTGEFLGMAGSSVDITERKEAEAVLARGKEELERLVSERTAKLHELVAELEHFSYSITHDMRAPLRAMRGFAEVIAEICAKRPEPGLQVFLDRIQVSAERMDALITDALNYSRAVRQEIPLAPIDVDRLLRGMLDTYPSFLDHQTNIRLEGNLPRVLGNEAALTQCFSNLIGNALKFVAPGQTPEVLIRSERILEPGSQKSWVRFWVEDKGIGIAPNMLPRVFDMFSRGNGHYEGTGIGLALVRKVVQHMGGRVGVQSEPGKGTRFHVDLPPGELSEGQVTSHQ